MLKEIALSVSPAITRNNVDLSSVRSINIHLRAILQKIPQPPIIKISLKISFLKFLSNLPGANELNLLWSSDAIWH